VRGRGREGERVVSARFALFDKKVMQPLFGGPDLAEGQKNSDSADDTDLHINLTAKSLVVNNPEITSVSLMDIDLNASEISRPQGTNGTSGTNGVTHPLHGSVRGFGEI
jgi:hypothetical protein